jgi:hypothetical protein
MHNSEDHTCTRLAPRGAESRRQHRASDWRAADAALERRVADAGAEHDAILFDYFVAQTEERVAEALSIQPRLAQYALPRVNL